MTSSVCIAGAGGNLESLLSDLDSSLFLVGGMILIRWSWISEIWYTTQCGSGLSHNASKWRKILVKRAELPEIPLKKGADDLRHGDTA